MSEVCPAMDTVRHWAEPAPFHAAPVRFSYREVALALTLFALVIAHQFFLTTRTQTLEIRAALTEAAAVAGALPATERDDEVRSAIRRPFEGRAVAIDSSQFPGEIDVTLRDLGRGTCLENERFTRRIEGQVVVQLVGFQSASACGDRNAMTWRILP